MKKYIGVLAIGALALTLVSCEKEFEVKNTGTLTGSDAATIVEADPSFLASYINGFYAWMAQYNTQNSSSAVHDDYGFLSIGAITDLMCQDVVVSGSWNWGTYDINQDYGLYTYSRPYQFWNFFYTLIKKNNEVIDFFGEEDPTNDKLRGYLGQAYALRAFSYTYLIQLFQDLVTGTTPDAALRDDAPAVPIIYAIRDGFSTDESDAVSGRNTVADLKAEIERNIGLALPLLDGYSRSSKNEVNYEVAQGIAARYYLLTQQWDKAVEAAQAARNGFDLMNKTRLASGFMDVDDKEVLWGFNHTVETQTSYASFFSHLSNDSQGYGGVGQSVHCIDRSLYDQIAATDYRKSLFNGPEGDEAAKTTGAKLPYASRKFGYAANWLQDYIYMRNAEMYLIEAEAEARLGNKTKAAEAIAPLMATRDLGWSKSEVTVDDILLQRRIELWGEGFGYFDLRRNGLGVNRKYEGTNHTAQAQYVFPAHAISWNFQIPNREMQNNPKITEEDQNEWVTGAAL